MARRSSSTTKPLQHAKLPNVSSTKARRTRQSQSPPPAIRVLAVITGGWGSASPERNAHFNTPKRLSYLQGQLQKYAQACELGYDVDVVVSTYAPWNHTGIIDMSNHFCSRIMRSLPVKVVLWPVEPIPAGAFAAEGTLAFKHRLIFQAERDNYDLFVTQEDDIAIEPHHLSYHLKWSEFFLGTNYYPGSQFFEITPWDKDTGGVPVGPLSPVPSSRVTVWRLSHHHLYRIKNVDFISPISINCCFYMLTQSQLFSATSRADWLQSVHTVTGEFNAYFGTNRWLSGRYRVAIPVEEIHNAIAHHLPHNYVSSVQITFGELIHTLSKCTNSTAVHERRRVGLLDLDTIEPLRPTSNTPCKKCLDSGSAVWHVMNKTSAGLQDVHFECIKTSEINWPEYEGQDRTVV